MVNNVTITETDTSVISVKERLKKQLYDGADMYNQDDGSAVENTYDYLELRDAKALIPVVKGILLSNGFRFDQTNAQTRFKEIFRPLGGTVYPIHCLCEPCEHCGNNYDFSESRTDLFFLHEGFMTPFFYLPEIIDYRKQYPDLAALENEIPEKQLKKMKDGSVRKVEIVKWKDSDTTIRNRKRNIDQVVAINSYLFNNNKAYVPYLVNKMPDFVENLVKTYGYTKEPSFNKFVLEKYAVDDGVRDGNYENNLNDFGETIFGKDCNKQLTMRTDLLDYISEHTDTSNTKLLLTLYSYVNSLYEDGSNNEIFKKYTKSERRKILAFAATVFDPYMRKHYLNEGNGLPHYLTKNYPHYILGLTLYFDTGAEQEYIVHNYYGHPKLKELLKECKDECWTCTK